jgi:hypothetical protein
MRLRRLLGVLVVVIALSQVNGYSCPSGSYFNKASVSSVSSAFLGAEYNVLVLDYHPKSDTTFAAGSVTEAGNMVPFVASLKDASTR